MESIVAHAVSLNDSFSEEAERFAPVVTDEVALSSEKKRLPRAGIAKAAAWFGASAGAGLTGAAAGAKLVHDAVTQDSLLRQYPFGLTSGWGAIIGALIGVLSMFSAGKLMRRPNNTVNILDAPVSRTCGDSPESGKPAGRSDSCAG